MITLFSGLLGSGKSYKMVAELSRCKDRYFVIHNIEKLKEGYLGDFGFNWIEYCTAENIEVTNFFSKEYQTELSQAVFEKYKRPVLVIIDEAHEWFDKQKKTLKMWLSYSRHLDQDIWLVAHRSLNIPSVYRTFIEVEYRAKSGSFIFMPWHFFYNRILGGVRSGFVFEKKDQKIFDLYKSKDIHSETKKDGKSFILPAIIAFSILGIIFFFWLPSRALAPSKVSSSNAPAAYKKTSPAVNQPDQKSNSDSLITTNDDLAEKYAFVGVLDDRAIIEDRKTGIQLALESLPLKAKLVKYDRNLSCTIFNGHKLFTLYNFNRFIAPTNESKPQFNLAGDDSGRQQRPESSPVNN